MSSPFKRNKVGSSNIGFGFLLITFLVSVLFYNLVSFDPLSSIGVYNNDNNADKVTITSNIVNIKDGDTIHVDTVSTKSKLSLSLSNDNPTHMDTDENGAFVHSGSFRVYGRQFMEWLSRHVLRFDNISSVLQYIQSVASNICPAQLMDALQGWYKVLYNAGVTEEQAVSFLYEQHNGRLSRLRGVLNDFFNTTPIEYQNSTMNFNSTFPKYIGPPINESPLAVYMARNPDRTYPRRVRSRSMEDLTAGVGGMSPGGVENENEQNEEGIDVQDEEVDLQNEQNEEGIDVQDEEVDLQNEQNEEGIDVQDEEVDLQNEQNEEGVDVHDEVNEQEGTDEQDEEDMGEILYNAVQETDEFVTPEFRDEVFEDELNAYQIALLEQQEDEATSTDSEDSEDFDAPENELVELVKGVFSGVGFNGKGLVEAAIKLVMATDISDDTFRYHLRESVISACKLYKKIKEDPTSENVVELEKALNDERAVMFNEMSKHIEKQRINLSQPYSRHTVAIVDLAYSPHGTLQENYHSMLDNQCCIRAMTQSVPRAVYYAYKAPDKSENTYTHLIKCVDLSATTAKKSDDLNDIYEQYRDDAVELGLESDMNEFFLINALVNINHHSLYMVANQGNESAKPLQTLVASASTARHRYGKVGKDRYTITEENIRYCVHPQALQMGTVKGKHYDNVRAIMSMNIIHFYSHVLGLTDESVQEERANFLEWFGRDWVDNDIEMGILSNLARLMDGEEELSLSSIENLDVTNLDEINKAMYDAQLEIHKDEAKLMKLLQKFRAGHYLQVLASELPDELTTLDALESAELRQKIDDVSKILEKKPKTVFRALRNIKKAQKAGGERLSLLNELASKLNKLGVGAVREELGDLVKLLKPGSTEEDALRILENQVLVQEQGGKRLSLLTTLASVYNDEGEASVKLRPEFQELIGLLVKGTKDEDALRMIENQVLIQAEGGKRLSLLTSLASIYIKEGEDVVKFRPEFQELLGLLVKGTKDEDVLRMIENQVLIQAEGGKRLSLLNKLASEYREGGEDVIRPRLSELVKLLKQGRSEEEALDMVINVIEAHAKKCEATFWKNLTLLEKYIKDNKDDDIFFKVDGSSVPLLVVRKKISGRSYQSLGYWWRAQINMEGSLQDSFGILAHNAPDDKFRAALNELEGFSFITDLVTKAINASRDKSHEDRWGDKGEGEGKSDYLDGSFDWSGQGA